MRPKDPTAWGQVDDTFDAALSAMHKDKPEVASVAATRANLQLEMAVPFGRAGGGGPVKVEGILVTDQTGHALPCEAMLQQVEDKQAGGAVAADPAAVEDLVAKATERCKADDDRNSDAFSAKALKALGQG